MAGLELRHLRYFVAIAEAGSVSRAAEKLFIAQPPLSVQVRQLEEDMGTALFVRHAKGVRLTGAGEALLPQARALLDRAARLRDAVRGAGEGVALSIGYVPSAVATVLPDLARRLRKTSPPTELALREMISTEQAEALLAAHIDAGLARTSPRHPRLEVAASMPDPFCLAVPLHESRGVPPAVPLKRYADRAFVGFTRHRGPAYFDKSIHLCARAGFSPRIRYEASTLHGVLNLVGAGLGVALVPASSALLGVPGVRLRRLAGPAPREEFVLLVRKGAGHPALPALRESVDAVFRAMRQSIDRATGA
jgi:DNA-binding transcriptional LysR family regulator